jgi:hypothetical protein
MFCLSLLIDADVYESCWAHFWHVIVQIHEQMELFKKVARGWGANPGSFDSVYFLIPSFFR